MDVIKDLLVQSKEYLILIAAIFTFVFTAIKEKYNSKKNNRPILQVTRTERNYIDSNSIFTPGIQVTDKHHQEIENRRKGIEYYPAEFLVIKNVSKNIALSLFVKTEDGDGEQSWKKSFAFDMLTPDHHILIPLGIPDRSTTLENIGAKIVYKTIDNEKLAYEMISYNAVQLHTERTKRKYSTWYFKYWLGFIKIPYMKIKDGDFYSYLYLK